MRLGVGELVVVDDDCMEDRNVNRILNSTMTDARNSRPKVEVSAEAVTRTGLGTRVIPVAKNLWDQDVDLGSVGHSGGGDTDPTYTDVLEPIRTAASSSSSLGNGDSNTMFRLREGIERFLITDINNAGGSNISQSDLVMMFDQGSTSPAGFNHIPGGSNVLYMDGHVQYIKYVPFSTETPAPLNTGSMIITQCLQGNGTGLGDDDDFGGANDPAPAPVGAGGAPLGANRCP